MTLEAGIPMRQDVPSQVVLGETAVIVRQFQIIHIEKMVNYINFFCFFYHSNCNNLQEEFCALLIGSTAMQKSSSDRLPP